MEQFQSVLLKVWQEACRHILLSEMISNVAPMLLADMPLDQILVRQIDTAHACVETVAIGFPGGRTWRPGGRTECSAEDMRGLHQWWARGSVEHCSADVDVPRPLHLVMTGGIGLDAILAPLGGAEGRYSVLVMIARQRERFQPRHLGLARVLRDPFTAAQENDSRLHELNALREAAEADKRSLLTRLGRKVLEDTVVGAGSGLRLVFERVQLVAPLDVPVLILGDTGSGKELIARAIHTRSPRAQAAFIRVNCGAIPSGLIDSQLFGHEKGAFTGATETRKGWFERADGGTLFLDEIGELPLAAQVRLLRILQDGWLERVGGQQPIHVDVRIVAATHRDLAADVAGRTFREDLWYRLAVFPIRLPALRERIDDIAELARHFARRAATRFGLRPVMPAPEDIRLLCSYHWPGNVRELASVIDRAAILGNGTHLKIDTALGFMQSPRAAAVADRPADAAEAEASSGFRTLDAVQRDHIEVTLRVAHGRIEGPDGAAVRLGLNPSTLRAKMRKLGIDWRTYRRSALPAGKKTCRPAGL
jgi:hydrogenase-4 transcriptional activator